MNHISQYAPTFRTNTPPAMEVAPETEYMPVVRFPTVESWQEYVLTERAAGRDLPTLRYCKYGCGGVGYLRRDLPLGHRLFGMPLVCQCKREELDRIQAQQADSDIAPSERRYSWQDWQGTDRQALERVKTLARQGWGFACLHGAAGVGKTGLEVALANDAERNKIPFRYLTVAGMMRELRASYDDKRYEGVFEFFCSVKILLLDEWGKEKLTDWVWEQFFAVMDARFRYYDRRLTLVATNETPDYNNPVWSRFSEKARGGIIEVRGRDVRPFQLAPPVDFS